MKINWKVRTKNPVFWMTIIPATITFVYCVFSAFEIVPGISESTVTNAFTSVITGLTAIGVLVDPTTEGLDDSELAQTYEVPKNDHEEFPNAEEE